MGTLAASAWLNRAGFAAMEAGIGEAVFRRRAIGEPVVHAEDFLADLLRVHVRTDRRDDAGEFVPRNRALANAAIKQVRGGIPEQFRRRHPRRVDADQQLPGAGLRDRCDAGDQGWSVGGIIEAHDLHRFHVSRVPGYLWRCSPCRCSSVG